MPNFLGPYLRVEGHSFFSLEIWQLLVHVLQKCYWFKLQQLIYLFTEKFKIKRKIYKGFCNVRGSVKCIVQSNSKAKQDQGQRYMFKEFKCNITLYETLLQLTNHLRLEQHA